MKETKSTTGSAWNGFAIIIAAIIIAGAGVFSVLQYNKTQWDIANLQKSAQIESSKNIQNGLNEIG
ncbi:MAG TPA: hypothetical protein VFS65_00875, partial [Candidatus Saccharimonadales bacterium]|nr:hypothetical protein [Candidatus Saccharimonadales bacterium]